MPDTTDLQKLPDDMEPHEDHPSHRWDRTCPGCWDELVLKRERALEAQQAELTLLREVAKRADDIFDLERGPSETGGWWLRKPYPDLTGELHALGTSLQAYKEFQKGSE